jgi:hypothetical protein
MKNSITLSATHAAAVYETYSGNNFTKSPAPGAGNYREPRLMSQVGTVREAVCA